MLFLYFLFNQERMERLIRQMFNTNIKINMKYSCILWSAIRQKLINEQENIQKKFTSKIKGNEELDYHERSKKLHMYSLERRKNRYLISYGWQQLEGIK